MSARKRAKRIRKQKPAPQEEQAAQAPLSPPQPQTPVTTVTPAPAAAAVPTVTQTEPQPETPAIGDAASPSEEPIVQEESLLAQDADQQEGGSGVKKMLLWFVLFVLLVIVVGGIAFFAYQLGLQNGKEQAQKEQSSVTPTQAAPTETPEEVDKGAYSIQVLNGSGISGEAARAKDLLEAEDFVVTDIGNADNDDNKETIIAKKKDIDDKYIAELKKVLETSYTLGDTKELDEDADDDIVITVGTPLEEE